MKKLLLIAMLLILVLAGKYSFSQGLENFNNYTETSNAYHNGTFTGQDGSTWSYSQCRGDSVIVAPSPTLGKGRNPTAKVSSGSIQNGCGTLSFEYKQPFTTAVNLNVYVNGILVKNVTSSAQGVLYNSGPINVNTTGNFVLLFKQADSTASGQVTIDNITWTAYNTVFPEPTSYPEDFSAVPSNFTMTLSWTDASGTQPPTAYLVKGSSQNNITAPVDGTPVADDPNLADGNGALNIVQGVQTCLFTDLPVNTPFYFAIFPYTNSGSSINYKTDGTWPKANATTPNTIIINQENFGSFSLGTWTQHSVTGNEGWTIDSIHGYGGTPCAKMSGYTGGASNENEDWLISPGMNFNNYINETFSVYTAKNYTGNNLEMYISNNYDGTGNPNSFTWTPLTGTLSAGGWVWTSSGNINVSGTNGTAVYIGLKYTSTTTASATWEVDNLLVTGEYSTGIAPGGNDHRVLGMTPNPASSVTLVSFGTIEQKTVKVLNLTGQVVLEKETASSSIPINVSELGRGIYFVQVIYADQTRQTRKLVVE
jgi:hypothetical protein